MLKAVWSKLKSAASAGTGRRDRQTSRAKIVQSRQPVAVGWVPCYLRSVEDGICDFCVYVCVFSLALKYVFSNTGSEFPTWLTRLLKHDHHEQSRSSDYFVYYLKAAFQARTTETAGLRHLGAPGYKIIGPPFLPSSLAPIGVRATGILLLKTLKLHMAVGED